MKIVFLFSDNFPGSSAYSNRVHSLAKGLDYYGNNIEVAVVYPGNKITSVNNEKQGVYDKVKYKYYSFVKFKSKNRINQLVIGVAGIFNFFIKILLSSNKKKPDVIISCSSALLHILILFLLRKFRGIKVLREYNEYPKFVIQNKNYFAKKSRYKLLDGFLFMTNRLKKFFEKDLGIDKKSTIINMTVDEDRFTKTFVEKKNYITLVGDVLGEKDGVEFLLKAFKKINNYFPSIKLKLVGNIGNKALYEKRLKLINELGLEGQVVFTGIVNREFIPNIMSESKLLLLSRPKNLQSESGFPTKLGEYLMSSTPVVITNTGEISRFLSNKENAFVCEANNVNSFANTVIFALKNYDLSLNVGIKGKNTALKHFSYKSQGKELNKFLNSLLN